MNYYRFMWWTSKLLQMHRQYPSSTRTSILSETVTQKVHITHSRKNESSGSSMNSKKKHINRYNSWTRINEKINTLIGKFNTFIWNSNTFIRKFNAFHGNINTFIAKFMHSSHLDLHLHLHRIFNFIFIPSSSQLFSYSKSQNICLQIKRKQKLILQIRSQFKRKKNKNILLIKLDNYQE